MTWLWESKIKSKSSFLNVLEFLYVPRKQYNEILPMIKPGGEEFYEEYIEKNYQFETENVL